MKSLKYIFAITVLTGFIYSSAYSQRLTSYWMQHLPQATYMNPAKQTNCKVFIDIPVLPNFDFNLSHSGFTINDAVIPRPYMPGSYMIDLNGIERALEDGNNINLETDFSILNFGISLKNDMYVSFGVNYKFSEYFQYPKALIEIRRGNYRENGTPLSFDFKQSLNLHREIYAGVSKNFNNTFYVGGKIKYLSGYFNAKADKMNVDWYTNTAADGMYEWTFNSDFDIKAASVIPWNFTDSADQITGVDIDTTMLNSRTELISALKSPGNSGLGIDIGIEYNIDNRLLLSASLIDLGFIKWKTSPKIMTQQATFVFDGVDIASYLNDTTTNDPMGERILSDIVDTLQNVFNPDIEETAYTSSLNSKIYLGANLKITDWLDAGFLYRGSFFNKNLISAYTFSANTNFFKAWSYTLSYSIMNYSANNMGMGLSYKIGPFQMYLITDNIAVPLWAVNESNFSDEMLRNTKTVNFSFGLNFLICGNRYDIGLME